MFLKSLFYYDYDQTFYDKKLLQWSKCSSWNVAIYEKYYFFNLIIIIKFFAAERHAQHISEFY